MNVIKFRKMKAIKTVVLGMTLIAGFAVNAQEADHTKKESNSTELRREHPPKEKLTPEQKAEKKAQKLSESLGLSAAQTEKIRIIELGIIQKNKAVRDNTSYSEEQKKSILKENRKAKMNMFAEVLTPEQMEKYKADLKAKAEAKKQKKK